MSRHARHNPEEEVRRDWTGAEFRAGTGLLGATESGQKVTPENMTQLPPGSVVRNGDGSRLIRLHDELWLWCSDHAWTYDRAEHLSWHLDSKSVACHIAPNAERHP